MGKLSMKRVEIAAPQRERKKIMETLQRRGVLELTDCAGEGLLKLETADSMAQFDRARGEAAAARSVLAEYLPAAKKSLLSSFSSNIRAMESADFDKQALRAEEILENCRRINGLRATVVEANAGIARLRTLMDQLRPWEALDIPMNFTGTAMASVFIGSVPYHCNDRKILDMLVCDSAEVEVVAAFAEQSNLFIVCHKSDEEKLCQALRGIGFAQPNEPARCPPAEQIEGYSAEMIALEAEIARAEAGIRDCAGVEGEIEFLIDYYTIRKDKYEALGSLGVTSNAFVVSGYIPEKYLPRVAAELDKKFTAAIEVYEPEEDEEVPVLLENNGFVAPVEGITEMYAVPSKDDIDPNPVMAFFYYFFFGMMLSDAGYGVLLTLGCAIALKKFNLSKKMRGNMKMFMYCGISTIFWGAMFGSWFGDIIQVICTEFLGRAAPRLYIWMDPVADPMKLLLVCFALGIVHLFAGVAANFAKQWKAGDKFGAFCDSIPIYLLVLGAAPLAGGMLTNIPPVFASIGKWVALAGLVLVVLATGRSGKGILGKLSKGLFLDGLYGIAAGYLGDIISYSRLLALGLCTGIIAGVMNMLGTIPTNLMAKGILLAIVFPIGHVLNMAINVLGAYVHTNRLHFVEMFGKFYEGGGRAFKPFNVKSKYIKCKEDLLND